MPRRLALALAAVVLLGLAVPGRAASSATLTLTAPGNGAAVLRLGPGVRLAWSQATLSTRGHAAAVVLDRLVPDRAHGTTTSVLAGGAGFATVRSAPADSAAYPPGFYRVYVVGDAAVTVRVPVSGLTSRVVTADEPLRPTVAAVDASASGSTPASVQAPVGRGPEAVVGLARWDTRRGLGPYSASSDVCLTTGGDCQGTATTERGLSLQLSGSSALTSSVVAVRGPGGAARLVSHLTGSEQPTRARLVAIGVPLALLPAPVTSGAPVVAVPVIRPDLDLSLRVGRLGGALSPVFTATGEGPAGVVSPAVSPDGTQVAFVEGTSSCDRAAVVFRDGTAHRWLSPQVGCMSLLAPVWSPDGTRAYVGGYDGTGGARVWVTDADGASAPRALHLPAAAVPTGITPDGSRLVVVLPPAPGQRWNRTGVVRPDGSGLRVFPGQGLIGVAVSPSGRVVAASELLRDGGDTVTIQTGLVDLASGRYSGLPATQPASGRGAARPLAWSADGRYLYYQWYGYTASGEDTPPRVYRITASGTGRTDVTPRVGRWNGYAGIQPMR